MSAIIPLFSLPSLVDLVPSRLRRQLAAARADAERGRELLRREREWREGMLEQVGFYQVEAEQWKRAMDWHNSNAATAAKYREMELRDERDEFQALAEGWERAAKAREEEVKLLRAEVEELRVAYRAELASNIDLRKRMDESRAVGASDDPARSL